MSKTKNPNLSVLILRTLADTGPMSICEMETALSVPTLCISAACAHLSRRKEIQHAPGPGFRLGERGKTYARWQINPHPPTECAPAATQRRANWDAALTPEDHAWMQHYREQRARRIAQSKGRGLDPHADGSR